MNKLLTLINIELKRNARFCFVYIMTFSFLIMGLNFYQIFNLSRNSIYLNSIKRNYCGVTYSSCILSNNMYLFGAIGIGLVGILLIYTMIIWKRDYNEHSIYTLLMLPENKFYIYLSKMIALIVSVYLYLSSSVTSLFISKNIFNIVFKNKGLIKTSFASDLSQSGLGTALIPTHFIDFIMVYGIWMILIISLLFTLLLIGNCFKDTWVIIVIMLVIPMLFYSFLYYRFSYEAYEIFGINCIGSIGVDMIINLILIVILNGISYILINKKLNI